MLRRLVMKPFLQRVVSPRVPKMLQALHRADKLILSIPDLVLARLIWDVLRVVLGVLQDRYRGLAHITEGAVPRR